MGTSLYMDACIASGSVVLFGIFTHYVWWMDLQMEINKNPFIVEIFWSTIRFVYLPMMMVCFVFGEMTRNLSQVDKIWSIVTPAFCWYITLMEATYHAMELNKKLLMMSVLVTVWGVRLTYQFVKKGGYTLKIWEGEEDYRWKIVRQEMPIIFENKIFFTLFNLGFICLYQILVLFLITAGVMLATTLSSRDQSRNNLTVLDVVIAGFMLLFVAVATISDHQHQIFQIEKYKRMKNKTSLKCEIHHYEAGFFTNGLFAYSRHPNFTAEQAIWLTFYLFSINFSQTKEWYQIGGIFNISIIGAILLIILFVKSTDLTEKISAEKYPLYKIYQEHVHRLFDVKLIVRKLLFGEDPDNKWLNIEKTE